MKQSVFEALFYLAKVAESLCLIEAAAGTSGNISVRLDDFPVEDFPEKGARNISHHKLETDYKDLQRNRYLITGSGQNLNYVKERPHKCLALIEIADGGYNILWGLKEGEVITSEHPAHFTTYQCRPQVSAFIHAQPRLSSIIHG